MAVRLTGAKNGRPSGMRLSIALPSAAVHVRQPLRLKMTFEPTRAAGLARLDEFAPRAAKQYGSQRNFDLGPMQQSAVSKLSPWIRHRLVTEQEVLARILAAHPTAETISFVQEVFWRSYFKGWLEQHPSVWDRYLVSLDVALENLGNDYSEAISGRTGIACFDHWCAELIQTGYLHNHARMWFASIWIFTLRLPWELGAAFFLIHLIDGDPASNTLSWRWVGGLHTKGKTYLASASNIARFTNGRFEPLGQLTGSAEALTEAYDHPLVPLPPAQSTPIDDAMLLVTQEDCTPQTFIADRPLGILGIVSSTNTGLAADFTQHAVSHASDKLVISDDWTTAIIDMARHAGTNRVVTAYAPVGPVATALAVAKTGLSKEGIELHQTRRPYDSLTWTHATAGFFKLKKKIPQILHDLDLG